MNTAIDLTAPGTFPIPASALHYEAEGRTRGYAQGTYFPPGVPGHLQLEPLLLCAHGQMLPGEGFDMHAHQGIENLLLVVSGRFRHRGSDGSDWVLGPGELLVMSTGSGAEHAEHVEGDEPVRCVVIHLRTDEPDATPRFSRVGPPALGVGLSVRAAGPTSSPGAAALRCDARLLTAELDAGTALRHRLDPARRSYLLVTDGDATIGGRRLYADDRLLVRGVVDLPIETHARTRIVLLDLP